MLECAPAAVCKIKNRIKNKKEAACGATCAHAKRITTNKTVKKGGGGRKRQSRMNQESYDRRLKPCTSNICHRRRDNKNIESKILRPGHHRNHALVGSSWGHRDSIPRPLP